MFGEGPTQVSEGKFTDTQRQPFTSWDVRFTRKENALYAICLGWPATSVNIQSLGARSPIEMNRIAQITLLGSSEPLRWSQREDGLVIQAPTQRPCDHAYTFKITLKDPA